MDDTLAPITGGEESCSPLQLHFLQRLGRLLRLRGEQSEQVNQDGLRLIDRAIYSTYCDTVDVGVGQEAQKLLHRLAVTSQAESAGK